MNELGSKLAETQKVTGNGDAKPEQIAAALRPFGAAASAAGETLTKSEFTVPEIRKTSADATVASLGLAASAKEMAILADEMKGIDAAGKAIDDQRKTIDSAEAQIKKACEANANQCVDLAKVLAAFPPPPDKTDNAEALKAWSTKLNAWASDLAKVEVKDASLKGHVSQFDSAWRGFAVAMSTLASVSDTAKKYDESAKKFNAQIDAANKAISEANSFCTQPG
jgi:predicted  nucleic acid-binding Zn-ribbon protein